MPAQRTGILGKQEPEPSGSSLVHLSSQSSAVLVSNSMDILSSGGVSGVSTVTSVGGKPIVLHTVSPGAQGTIKLNAADIEKLLLQSAAANASGAVTVATQSGSGSGEDAAGASNLGTTIVQTVVSEPKVGMKRSMATQGSPMVTKVIITKTPNSGQPQAVPAVGHGGQLPVAISLHSGGLGVISQSLLSQAQASPTKTVTLTSQGVVSPIKTVIATIAGTPTKAIPISTFTKVPLSPVKSPPKIHMIPVSIAKTPQKLGAQQTLLARSVGELTVTQAAAQSNSTGKSITMSPSKVIIKQAPVVKTTQQIAPAGTRPVLPMNVASSVQQISVPGSKFHYVRLVAPSQASVSNSITTTTSSFTKTTLTTASMAQMVQAARQIAPATLAPSAPTPSQVKITLPVQGGQLVAPKTMGASSGTSVQRILLPAPNQSVTVRAPVSVAAPPTTLTQLRPSPSGSTSTLSLPPGTTLLSSAANIQGLQGFALVPATYVSQLNKQTVTQVTSAPTAAVAVKQQRSDYVPIASSDPVVSANVLARNAPQNGDISELSDEEDKENTSSDDTTLEATGARPRKPCNCTKSQCLKLYCDCFANGEFCHNCNCTNCANNLEHEEERSRAIKSCLDRNPMAFHPKIGKGRSGDNDRRHNKGCNCKRSGCLKNYCECYEAKIMCSSICKCVGCKNFEESPERKNLMHLADAAEVRVQQAQAAKSKLANQISGLPFKPPPTAVDGERLPYTLITTEVAEAMCACLLAQAEEAERLKSGPVVQERLVLEEFGRCLMQIIDSAKKDDRRDCQ